MYNLIESSREIPKQTIKPLEKAPGIFKSILLWNSKLIPVSENHPVILEYGLA